MAIKNPEIMKAGKKESVLMSLLRKPFRSVSRKSPPLALVIFWNVFTSIHAAVMLHGLWGNPVIVFLLLFYAVFFAVGIFMARA
jgi:hypothetical protein